MEHRGLARVDETQTQTWREAAPPVRERFRMSPDSPEEVLASIAAAVNTHDLDAFVALHEPNAAVVVPPEGLVRASGHDAIRRALEPLFDRAPSVKVDLHGMLRSGGLAMSHTHFAVTLTDDDGERVESAGVGTVVSREQPDGSWLIVFDYPLRA
jgi:uncharacterized protein (TIGR02246 family)